MASRNRWIWHLWLSCNHPFQTKFPAAFQNYLERQSCRKFPATSLKPVTVRKMFKGKQNTVLCFFPILSRLFQILFVPFSLLFVAKKRNTWKLWRISPTWNCVTFPRLATFGQDMRLLSVTLFSLRRGFLGRPSTTRRHDKYSAYPYPYRGGGRGGDKTNLSNSIFFCLETLG